MIQPSVLDAWALLAYLQGEEPAASHVLRRLEQALVGNTRLLISIINLGEVIYRVGKVKGEKEAWETLNQLRRLPVQVLSATDDVVWLAVDLKMRYPISYADAFAAATALHYNAVLLTGDPELLRLGDRLSLEALSRYAP